MNKVYINIILLLFGFQLKSQSINCVRNISTNPEDPINNEFTTDIRSDLPNYFLNTNFNWYPNGSIQIDPTRPWVRSFGGNQNFYQFKHPYAPSMPDQFRYLSNYPDGREIGIADLDLYWEDGWELLWMNLGYLPNGASTGNVDTDWSSSGAFPISPDNVPFFVLYNRYRGLLRVFANVWYTEIGQWDDIKVKLAFDVDNINPQTATYSGLLRHGDEYDVALDELTKVTQLISPRFSAPGNEEWIVADFQMAYDPCQCQNQSKLELEFIATDTVAVDLISRSISTNEKFTTSNYKDKDFLNLSNIGSTKSNGGAYHPGTGIYRRMDEMLIKYNDQLQKYEDELNEYNSVENQIKKSFIDVAKDGLSSGIVNTFIPAKQVEKFILSEKKSLFGNVGKSDTSLAKNVSKDIEKALKSTLSKDLNFLSGVLDITDKPTIPTPPTATFKEEVFTGYITNYDSEKANGLYVPGTVPTAYSSIPQIEPYTFPAYNEVLGLFAVLESPPVEFYVREGMANDLEFELAGYPEPEGHGYMNGDIDKTGKYSFYLPNGISYAKNPALDWDEDSSSTLVAFQIELEIDVESNEFPFVGDNLFRELGIELRANSNFEITHRFYNETERKITLVLTSSYYPIIDIKNTLFQFEIYFNTQVVNYRTHQNTYDIVFNRQNVDFITTEITETKLKIFCDNYFHQLDKEGEQVTSFQLFTHDVGQGLNQQEVLPQWIKYESGTIKLMNNININHPYVHAVSNSDLIIRGENIIIDDGFDFTQSGSLTIEATRSIIVSEEVVIPERVTLSINHDMLNKGSNLVTLNTTVISEFCDLNYSANTVNFKLGKQINEDKDLVNESLYESKSIDFAVYPNPTTSNIVNVRFSHPSSFLNISLSDLNGKIFLKEHLAGKVTKEFELDFEGLADGVYILHIQNSEGQTFTERLVKNN